MTMCSTGREVMWDFTAGITTTDGRQSSWGTLMNGALKQRVALFTNVHPGILIKEHTHLCLAV